MNRSDAAARTMFAAFADADRRTRLHVRGRWTSCPFGLIEQLVPREGTVLDLGCGHGHFAIYLALCSTDRSIVGVDVDSDKIDRGHIACHNAGVVERVELTVVESTWRPPADAYDAVVTNDVLYLMGEQAATDTLVGIAETLRPGGRAIVKEMGDRPGWKLRLNEMQEHAAATLGITKGSTVEVLSVGAIEAPFLQRGFQVDRHPMDRHFLHPHLTVTADRPHQ